MHASKNLFNIPYTIKNNLTLYGQDSLILKIKFRMAALEGGISMTEEERELQTMPNINEETQEDRLVSEDNKSPVEQTEEPLKENSFVDSLIPPVVNNIEQKATMEKDDVIPVKESPPKLEQPRTIRRVIISPLYTPSFNYKDLPFFSGLLLITVLSFATRLYCLNEPNHVA